MLVQIPVGFRALRSMKLALGFRAPMGETIFSGALLGVPHIGPFAGGPKVDDFSHAWS